MSDRREFLKHSAQVAAAIAAANAWKVTGGAGELLAASAAPAAPPLPDSTIKALMMDALNAAKSAGASYADVRVGRQQQNFIFTRENQIQNVVDTDSVGCGVRALVDGAWGFSATRNLTTAGVTGAAKEAVAVAKANKMALDRPTVLAPAPVVPSAVWKSAYKTDPWDVSVEEKADLLLRANAIALKTPNVKYVFSGLFFVKAQRDYANSDGSVTSQTTIRSWPLMQITAVAPDFSDFQNRGNVVPPMGRGWEYVLSADLAGNAAKWADEAAQKLKAKPVEPGKYDLVLHPSHLWLTIHESIGHPTELDRALGYEANYAGTSFVSPPEKVLGKLKNGIFNDYQTTREQAEWISWWYKQNNMETRSHGCSYAQGWDNVQFQRMPNVSLLPGEKDLKWEDLIAATDNGIAIIGDCLLYTSDAAD